MNKAGYSLLEVMITAGIVAIGLAAAAAMINSLMFQEEINAGAVRAANLQEQAVMLHRLGLTDTQVRNLLPEVCGTNATPARDTFSVTFSAPTVTNMAVGPGTNTWPISLELTTCTLIYASPSPDSSASPYRTNTVGILRPVIR
jgi:prepilin-type N-terminal cleavage/methylation domain-containing protein